MNTKRIVIYTLGTFGDVKPMLDIAKYLANNGYDVDFLSCEYFRNKVEESGIKFISVASTELYVEVFSDPYTWTLDGLRDHYERFHYPAMEPSYKHLKQLYDSGERPFVILQDVLSGARMACKDMGLKFAHLVLAPSGIHSNEDPSFPLSAQILPRDRREVMPKIEEKQQKQQYEKIIEPLVNPFRRSMGLPAWGSNDSPGVSDSEILIACFPAWYRSPPDDWPSQLFFGGFPISQDGAHYPQTDSNSKLASFLEQHRDRPLVFTFGTGGVPDTRILSFARDVSQAFERPCIFVAPYLNESQVDPTVNSEYFLTLEYVDFHYLFPRSALVIHHGGIGTAAEAIAAGIPQLILPMTFDQPDNAHCLWKLGVANALDYYELTLEELVSAIDYLISDQTVSAKVYQYKERLLGTDGVHNICSYIEDNLKK